MVNESLTSETEAWLPPVGKKIIGKNSTLQKSWEEFKTAVMKNEINSRKTLPSDRYRWWKDT